MSQRSPGFSRASVIVSTYNRPDALTAVLAGFGSQSSDRFEVVVADDGSDDQTRAVVDDARRRHAFPIAHAWQEDRGFRLSASRNRAVLEARGDYLIFLDGDCIPRPDFVANHRWLSEPGWFVRGTRAALSEGFTDRVLQDRLPVHEWTLPRWLWATAVRELKDPTPLLTLRNRGFRKRSPEKWRGAQTCNLGVWARDFERVDGFDEAYVGWGMDDADLAVRLIRAGIRRKEGKFAVGVLHLWHAENDKSMLDDNVRRFEDTLGGTRTRARVGLSSHQGA